MTEAMLSMRRWMTMLAAVVAVAGCGAGEEPESAGEGAEAEAAAPSANGAEPASGAELERARAAALDFGGQLRGALSGAIEASGPIGAIEVCHGEAPAIAEAVMQEHGVRLGRMSVPGRNRHPGQDASGWQAAVLADFQQAVAAGESAEEQGYVARDEDAGELRFARGIATEPVCLVCHGPELAPDVADAIAGLYPEDRATGFEVGDLRGLLWVEVPIE